MKILVPDDASVGRSAPLHPLGDGVREGCDPLALSRGLFDRKGWFPTGQRCMFFRACSVEGFDLRRSCGAVLAGALVPDDAGVGRAAPLHPLEDGVREGSHPLALSRRCSTGDVGFRRNRRAARFEQRRIFFVSVRSKVPTFDEAVGLFWRELWFPRTQAWGSPLPYTPSGDGCADEILVPDGTGGRRFWGSSACSSAPVRSKISTSDEAVWLFWRELWFPTTRAWGALLPYTPSGTGCERVHTLSRSPGAVRSEVLVSDGTGGR